MGGEPAGRVEPGEHDYAEWERRVDALMVLLTGIKGGERRMTVDELRKNIEALPPEAYETMSYYERWVTSLANTMIQRGLVSSEELARRMIGNLAQRAHHDMGGLPAGRVEPGEHQYEEWERRVDALSVLLGGILPGTKKRVTVDERRKAIEMLPPQAYDRMGYYERWVVSLVQTLVERGLVSTAEIARKMVEVEKRR